MEQLSLLTVETDPASPRAEIQRIEERVARVVGIPALELFAVSHAEAVDVIRMATGATEEDTARLQALLAERADDRAVWQGVADMALCAGDLVRAKLPRVAVERPSRGGMVARNAAQARSEGSDGDVTS